MLAPTKPKTKTNIKTKPWVIKDDKGPPILNAVRPKYPHIKNETAIDKMALMVGSNILDLFSKPHITAAVITHGIKKENIPRSVNLCMTIWNGSTIHS